MIKIDHFYITVTDLDKAIDFYQKLLGKKISHREKNRWADFKESENEVYFGIYNATVDGEKFTTGSSPTLSLKTDDVELEYKRIKGLNPKNISEVFELTQPARYKYFQFEDEWGNVWEVAEYNY
jgi:predicted enzyme related to lactoylglutathione lyase